MFRNILVIIVLIPFFQLETFSQVLVKTNIEGEVIEGSIESLISAIQEGSKIRVGWSMDLNKDGDPDLEHWIDANFISILGGHVFNQIDPIFRQIPKLNIPQVQIKESDMQWTGIIGTNSKLIHRYIIPNLDQIDDELMRSQLEKRTAIKEMMVSTIWSTAN